MKMITGNEKLCYLSPILIKNLINKNVRPVHDCVINKKF